MILVFAQMGNRGIAYGAKPNTPEKDRLIAHWIAAIGALPVIPLVQRCRIGISSGPAVAILRACWPIAYMTAPMARDNACHGRFSVANEGNVDNSLGNVKGLMYIIPLS